MVLSPQSLDSGSCLALRPACMSTAAVTMTALERESLIVNTLPLIKQIAHKMAMRLPATLEMRDLVNAGVLGLLDAIDKFAPERGVKFKTYAEVRIRGAILDRDRTIPYDFASSAITFVRQALRPPAAEPQVKNILRNMQWQTWSPRSALRTAQCCFRRSRTGCSAFLMIDGTKADSPGGRPCSRGCG